jgi:hypothetical protein
MFPFSLSAQVGFNDAIELDKKMSAIDPGTGQLYLYKDQELKVDVARRLRNYLPDSLLAEQRVDEILKIVLDTNSEHYNPILADLFPPPPPPPPPVAPDTTADEEGDREEKAPETDGLLSGTGTRGGLGLATGLSGLPVTNIADGLARFMVKRTKQELNQAFFRRFYMALEDPRFVEFKLLYPQTYQVFSTADRDIYRYNYFMGSLQESFRVDLKTLPLHVADLIQHPKYAPRFKHDYHRSLASLALVSSQEVVNGSDPQQALHNIAFSDAWRVDDDEITVANLKGSMQLLDLLSQNMRAARAQRRITPILPGQTEPEKPRWLSRENLNALLASENEYALKIFLGLLYQQAGDISFVKKDTSRLLLRDLLVMIDDTEDQQGYFRTYVSQFGQLAIQIDQELMNLKNRDKGASAASGIDSYYKYSNAFIGAIEQGLDFKSNTLSLSSPYDSVFLNVLNHGNQMGLDIHFKNYSSAVVNMVQVLQNAIAVPDFEYKSELLRYSSFIASVAGAVSSEEIAYAIEAVALPVGSSAIKKYSSWNLAIQSYVGGFYGLEVLEGVSNEGGQVFGMTAPVGIAISRGISPFQDAGSLTLFVPLIDIGAVTAFRFQDPLTETLPEITLQNIYAPGAYLIYGFPRWPVSFGTGFQMGPQLRQVDLGGNNIVDANGYRVSAFLAVDIPIFNLYTSMR